MRTRITVLISVVAVAIAGAALAAGSFRTKIPATQYAQIMSQRDVEIPCSGIAEAPSGDITVAVCRMDRPALLQGVELVVGRSLGSGSTTMHVQLNAATIASSSVAVAAAAGGAGRATATIRQELNSGDILRVVIGGVTSGTNSRNIVAKAVVYERFY